MGPASRFAAFLILSWACTCGGVPPATLDKTSELLQLQAKSSDAVIHLDTELFNKYLAARKRQFTVIGFLNAEHLYEKEQLHLKTLRKEFGYVAKACRATHKDTDAAGKVFFVELEFTESREVFHRLSAQALPFIFRLSTTTAVDNDGLIKLKDSDHMKHEDYSRYPWLAEDMAAFVMEKTGLAAGNIDKPSLVKSPFFPFIALSIIGCGGYFIYLVCNTEFVRHPVFLTVGSLTVYWFSVSGGMHNIIRGVPLYVFDKNGNVQWFINSAQGQLGAEGFLMGTLYNLFGLSLAILTWGFPGFEKQSRQRPITYSLLFVTAFAFYKIVGNYTSKTGYHWRTYL